MNYDRMHDWLANLLTESKTVKVPMPFTTYTYIADPANVEYVLKTNFNYYPKGEVYHSYMEVLLGDGIFNSDGEMWRKQRKTSSFEFASKKLRDFSTIVFREYAMKLSSILCQASVGNKEIDMQELLMRMTLDSICKVGFGVEIGTLAPELPDNHFARAFDTANIIVTLRFIDPLWRLKRFLKVGSEALLDQSMKVINDFTYSMINKRKAEIQEAKTSNKNGKVSKSIENPDNNLTDKSLRDVLNFVIAGRDTTATTLSWFVYMMIVNPHVADKLLAQFASLLTYDSLSKLSYLHAAITETVRLYPAVPQSRRDRDLCPYSMGRMVYNWGSDAASFNPDRWFNQEGLFQNASPFKFTSFQNYKCIMIRVPSVCAGRTQDLSWEGLGVSTDENDTAIVCRFFNFHLIPNHPVKYRMITILSMQHDLKLTVTKRSA
ncbi:hypothetical protein MKX01_039427 [Papaver californicum]|nr:hypothetical protein MKX01_039427 [Papaver californicum]